MVVSYDGRLYIVNTFFLNSNHSCCVILNKENNLYINHFIYFFPFPPLKIIYIE